MTQNVEGWETLMNQWKDNDFGKEARDRALDGARSPAGGSGHPRFPSNQALEAQVKSDAKKSRFEAVLSVAMAAGLSGYIAYEIVTGLPSIYDYILYSGFLLIFLLVGSFTVQQKRRAWRCEGDDTTSYLNFLHRQAKTATNLARLGQRFALAILVLVFSLASVIAVQMVLAEQTLARPVMASVILGFVGLFFPAMILLLRRGRRSLESREATLVTMLRSTRLDSSG